MTERNQIEEQTRNEARPVSVSARLGRLQFHNSGKFRVLQFADIQDGPKVSGDTIRLIAAATDAARPDVVVFTGNQIAGYDPAYADTFHKRRWTSAKPGDIERTRRLVRDAIASFVGPLVERGVPFAVTYGNHDFQCGLSNAELDAIYREFPGCLNIAPDGTDATVDAIDTTDAMDATVRASSSSDVTAIARNAANVGMRADGPYAMPTPQAAPMSGLPDQRVYPLAPGTFALPVMDADRTRTVLALAVTDSGDYSPEGGYGKPDERTLDFLYSVPEMLGAKALVFQHMPVPQYYDLLKAVAPDAPGAIQGYRAYESQYYVLDEAKTQPGSYLGEGVSCPDYDSGEFALLRDGGYFGIVAGHDHRNGFVGESEGVMMVASPTCGFGSYGPAPEKRAARLFEFDIRHPYHPRTQLLEFGDLVGKPSSRKAYSYDIASVKSDTEGMNLLHKKNLWSRLRGWFRR
ncbi:serine/threonine protein phosphatase [Bifidobacterium ramosum]|uniref:Serine/threonine protein phosphatase n=1 Tax=Bifidobacterium ramosum TaxID=1798158 RepID=A0A6L4WYC0_9BIFI|nr:metallophosphoesterase [Bifidobacterium ramosum]KAB8287085.1 serine/threonine protein phosphatase [Bifidobacterium ramosum]NEG71847.1 serine/threonine protein phosphatase [Bifidobacterium ramosum]